MRKSPHIVALSLMTLATAAQAEYIVRSPVSEKGELAIAAIGNVGHDSEAAKNNEQSFTNEISYGVTSYWTPEVEVVLSRDPGDRNSIHYDVTTFASLFTLPPHSHGPLNLGLWTEYGLSATSGKSDTVKFGPLAQVKLGKVITTANFYVERDVGSHASDALDSSYAAQVKYEVRKWLSPAIEAYGNIGNLNQNTPTSLQQDRVGPVLVGEFEIHHVGGLKYELGYLQGVNGATPSSTLKWVLEYGVEF